MKPEEVSNELKTRFSDREFDLELTKKQAWEESKIKRCNFPEIPVRTSILTKSIYFLFYRAD